MINYPREDILPEFSFASCFGFFLAFYTWFLIIFSFTGFLDCAVFRDITLKTTQCIFDRFILVNSCFSHKFPSLRITKG